jgi:hypothetical protein
MGAALILKINRINRSLKQLTLRDFMYHMRRKKKRLTAHLQAILILAPSSTSKYTKLKTK